MGFAQEKLELPFVFLNQYFEYDISEGNIYSIGGHSIEWDADFVTIENDKIVVKLQPILKGSLWDIAVRDINNKLIYSSQDVNFNKTTKFALPKEMIDHASRFCLSTRNRITSYLMCKSITAAPAAQAGYPKVLINKAPASKFGRVILTDPKKNVQIEIQVNSIEFIRMMTKKRTIVPSTVKKNVERKDYEIKFVDIELDNFSWVANVGYEQEAFVVPNDKLVKVYQDYFNKDHSNKEMDLVYYEPPYKRMRIMNMYSFSPFFGFSKFEGNTRTKSVSILTEYDISLRTYLMKQMPRAEKWKFISRYFPFWTASANFRSMKYISSANNVTVVNPGAFLYNISGSLNRIYSERISYAFRLAIEKNTSLDYESPSSSQVIMSSVLNKELGMQGSINLYDHGRFVSFLHGGFAFLAPTQISGSTTKMGTRTYIRSDLHYADGNKLYGVGFHYNLRQQETDRQKFKDQTFDYTASYSIAF